MNNQLQDFARKQLKEGLAECTKEQQHLFKQMYCFHRLETPINEAVDAMPEDKLDWAMEQVRRTLEERAK